MTPRSRMPARPPLRRRALVHLPARLLVTTLSLAFTLPAAAGTAWLQGRDASSQISLWAGYGVSRVDFPCAGQAEWCELDGSTGSAEVWHGLAPATISVAGSASGTDTAVIFSTEFTAQWAQTQTFQFMAAGADAVLQAAGSLAVQMAASGTNGIDPPQPATQRYTSRNWQVFHFTLDQDTAYTLAGESYGGQKLEMWWTDAFGQTSFMQHVIGATGAPQYSGQGWLPAGRYVLSNYQFDMASGLAQDGNGWAYALTLHNTVAVVPEPATALLLAGGLAGLVGRARRRGRQGPLGHGAASCRARPQPFFATSVRMS